MSGSPNRKTSRSITMKDVARLAGVSQPTVSRVLNNTATPIAVSEATREKVLRAVAELGYRPNMTARSLRTQHTQMIALLIADISNGFYHPIARSVQEVAREHDYDLLIADSDHRHENEKHFCEAVVRRPVDGVIVVPIHLNWEDLDRLTTLAKTPVVALGQHVQHPAVDVIGVDDHVATRAAITWLLNERGYKTVGYLGVPDSYPPGPRRFQGYQEALEAAGHTLDPRFIYEGDFSLESGHRAARMLLEQPVWPRAIFAVNDLMAIGLILELRAAGVSVPEDLAVMGFDDIAEATIVRPTLTTIAQDPADIGRKLASALFDRITGNVTGPRRWIESSWEIIPRESA